MPQSYTCLNYHIIVSTKHRKPWIAPELQPRLFEYMGGIVRNLGGKLLAAGGMPDHVHLLASLLKTRALADDLRDIKANSSGWIHDIIPELSHFAWQTGYAAFTVSYSNIPSVKTYFADQAEHHRKKTFKEEFIEFLQTHEIEYDPKYVFE